LEPSSVAEQDYWRDESLRSQPYERGFLLAMHLDLLARRRGGDLGTAVGRLLRTASAAVVGPDRLQRALEAATGQSLGTFFRDYASGSEPLPLADWLGEAGLSLGQEPEAAASSGMVTVRLEWTVEDTGGFSRVMGW
jgi:predicted metalloprotease with PDZ domain